MTKGLNYELIKKAISGDEVAINKIVKIYEPYINTLVSTKLYDADGNEFIGIDVDLQEYLKTKLIEIILKYKVA